MCSQQDILELFKFCVDWQLIGAYLKLTEANITAVDGDYYSVTEKRMLRRWREKFSFKATYRVFIEALSCGKPSDALEAYACKTIASSK